VDFSDADLNAIERACRLQAGRERELQPRPIRPVIRNQRQDSAEELERIANAIQSNRRQRAPVSRRVDD
jgi:hypothetical protein